MLLSITEVSERLRILQIKLLTIRTVLKLQDFLQIQNTISRLATELSGQKSAVSQPCRKMTEQQTSLLSVICRVKMLLWQVNLQHFSVIRI